MKRIIFSLLAATYSLFAFAQFNAADSLVFKAMEDEMNRSMTDLQYKTYEKPCFVKYRLENSVKYDVTAQLGALLLSDSTFSRGWSYRLLVGDYEISDENFRGEGPSRGLGLGIADQSIPEENDYYGIRRGFWLNTNDIYIRTAINHHEKIQLIEDGKISRDKLEINDFASAPKTEMYLERKTKNTTLSALEKQVKELSDLYESYDFLSYSSASLAYSLNDVFLISTEGTRNKLPIDIANLNIRLWMKVDENKEINTSLSVAAPSPEQLPDKDKLLAEADKLAKNLQNRKEAQALEDDYNGPVLFVGEVVSDILMRNLFGRDHSLIAERNDLVVSGGDVYFDEIKNNWQEKMDKTILPKGLDIMERPALKEYKGVKLMGSYPIDSEGVVPVDSLVLVKDGILKAMLSSRVPTSVTESSTGHSRYIIGYTGVGHAMEPSVMHIHQHGAKNYQMLKQQLIEKAKEEELDYAILIKSIPSEIASMPYNYFRIDVETGQETMITDCAKSSYFDANKLKKMALGGEEMVLNMMSGGSLYGCPISYIGPSVLLMDEVEIEKIKSRKKIHVEKDAISCPLVRTSK